MILKTRNPLPVQQQPPPIPPYPSPLPCAEPQSLRKEQIKSKYKYPEALAGDQEGEQGKIPLQRIFGKDVIKGTVEPE